MASSSIILRKRRLEQTPMRVNSFCVLTESFEKSFECTIQKFRSLKRNRTYSIRCSFPNWDFALTINRNNYTFEITTSGVAHSKREIAAFIRYSDGIFSTPVKAQRVEFFLYKVEIPIKLADVPQNLYLRSGSLSIVFKTDGELSMLNAIHREKSIKQPRYDKSKKQFFIDLATAYYGHLYTDFFIIVDDEFFKVHKSILSARSMFFRKFLKESPERGLEAYVLNNASYTAAKSLLDYLYTGQVYPVTQADWKEIINMANVFCIVKIIILMKRRAWFQQRAILNLIHANNLKQIS